jgi:hypothetical protein
MLRGCIGSTKRKSIPEPRTHKDGASERSRESARMAKPLEQIAAYNSKRWSTLGENL